MPEPPEDTGPRPVLMISPLHEARKKHAGNRHRRLPSCLAERNYTKRRFESQRFCSKNFQKRSQVVFHLITPSQIWPESASFSDYCSSCLQCLHSLRSAGVSLPQCQQVNVVLWLLSDANRSIREKPVIEDTINSRNNPPIRKTGARMIQKKYPPNHIPTLLKCQAANFTQNSPFGIAS